MRLSFIIKTFFYCFIASTIFLSGIFYLFLHNRTHIKDLLTEYPFSELVYQHSWDKISLNGKDILAGQRIKGQFTASANRLGGIGIKFNTHNRINSDSIIFRFKEEGKNVWYYEQDSKTDQIRREVFWPFGFPPISDSEGKRYEFEIESVKGTIGDTVAINSSQKTFIAEYTYPKQWLLNEKQQIPYFVKKKLISLSPNLDNKFHVQIIILAVLSMAIPFVISQLKRLIFVVRKIIKIIIVFFLLFIFLGRIIIRLLLYAPYALEGFLKRLSVIYRRVPFLIIVSFILLIIGVSTVFLDQKVFLQDSALMTLTGTHKWGKNILNKGNNLAIQIQNVQRPLDETSALQAGEKINGRFISDYNYLGTVSIGIFDFYRENTDRIIFRLREVGEKQWYYEHIYDTNSMRSNIIWPFGFPPIADSKGKQYEFEIESTQGKIGNAIAILPLEPSFFTKYQYSFSIFVNHPEEILSFTSAKIYLPFSKIDRPSWVFLIILPLLPLILYLFGLEKMKHMQFAIKANNNGQIFGLELKRERFQVGDDRDYVELFSKISIALITIIVVTRFIYNTFTPRTKDLDWYVFEFITVLTAGMFLGLGVLLNKKKVSFKMERAIRFSVLIIFFIFLVVVFTNKMFSLNFLHYSMFLFLFISFIPMLPVIENHLRKKRKGGYFTVIGKNMVEIITNRYFLVNIISVFVVISFFFETLLNTPNRRIYFVTWILSSAFLSYIAFNYKFIFQSKLREYIPLLKIFKISALIIFCEIILILITSLFISLAIHGFVKSYLYYLHSSFFIGPAQDIIRGKSLLYDTPSQYGYLSMHFISLAQRFIGGTVEIFDRFDTSLYIIFTITAGFIFYKLTDKKLYSYLLAIMYLGFPTFFSDYRDFIYPSSGPLRFGFGILICFFLLYFPGRIAFFIGTMLSAISVFWSSETGVYVVPAWLFTCFVIAWRKHGKNMAFVKEMSFKIAALFLCVFILGFGIFLKEYRPESGLPNFYNFIQYSQMYKSGYFSIITPLYGNYYFYVFIIILGLGVVFHMLTKKLNSRVLPALAFIAIYNIAIYSYFVYRSWYSLIISNAGFLLIELVLMYKVLYDTGKFNTKVLKIYFGVPVIIFCTLFVFKSVYNTTSPVLAVVQYNFTLLTGKKLSTPPFLNSVVKDYNAKDKDIILLSEYDTFYLAEAKVKNFLPLNPAVMTFLLPDWKKKYIDPKINRIPKGTLMIFDPHFQDPDPNVGKKLTFIKNEIKKLYEVSLIGQIEDKTVSQTYGPPKRKKIEIYRVNAKK